MNLLKCLFKILGLDKKIWTLYLIYLIRQDKSLSRNAEGTSVGLSLVKFIAELAGGSINVESQSGKGRKFTGNLPSSKVLQGNMQFDNALRNWKDDIHVEFSDSY